MNYVVPKLDLIDQVIYLREKPLKDHPIVIGFFGVWSVEGEDVRCIEHHFISHL